jgi:hypothetical protein
MPFSHTRLFPHLSGFILSPSNVFFSKVSGTQSDATYYQPEQDIIETHHQCSPAIHRYRSHDDQASAMTGVHQGVVPRQLKITNADEDSPPIDA